MIKFAKYELILRVFEFKHSLRVCFLLNRVNVFK